MADDDNESQPAEPESQPAAESEPTIVELPEGPENLEYRGGRPFDRLLIRKRDESGDGEKQRHEH